MSAADGKLSTLGALGLDGTHAGGVLRSLAARAKGSRRWHEGFERLLTELREKVGRSRGLPLELDLTDRTVRFRSLDEFEFSLASRTEYPVHRVDALMDRPPGDLRKIAAYIRGVEKRFAQVLTESIQQAGMVGELMREVEIKHFSRDHGWRDLVEALNQKGSDYDEYKRLALVKYMQYLASRQDVLRSIYLDKTRGGGFATEPSALETNPHETAIFAAPRAAGDTRFVAMPRGETLTVHMEPGRALELELSGHAFRLYGGRHFYLIDENGAQHLLRPGKNMVGRHEDCEVIVDPRLRAVSRRHLIIETVGADTAMLTDVSAHGTSIQEHYVGI